MKVSFSGTREGLSGYQWQALGDLLYQLDPELLIHGDCVGADSEADMIAENYNVLREAWPCTIIEMRAYCKVQILHDPMPPLERNRKIVDCGDLLVACPLHDVEGRSGTWATIRYARIQHKDIAIINKKGEVRWVKY